MIFYGNGYMPRRYGLFTELQLKVMKLRSKGLTLREIAKITGTSHQNIAVAEKRALEKLRVARETIILYNLITSAKKLIIPSGTHLVDIPKMVLKAGDDVGVKLKADFTYIYKLIRFNASECVNGTFVVKPIIITISRDGYVNVYPFDDVKDLLSLIESI